MYARPLFVVVAIFGSISKRHTAGFFGGPGWGGLGTGGCGGYTLCAMTEAIRTAAPVSLQPAVREIEQFFEAYKRLEGDKEAQIRGWQSFDEPHELIRECMQAYARA